MQRMRAEVDPLVALALAVVDAQHVARDPEQEGEERGLLAESVLALDAGQKRLLDQVFDLAVGLRVEEPADPLEVALKEHFARRIVALTPRVKQLEVVASHPRAQGSTPDPGGPVVIARPLG